MSTFSDEIIAEIWEKAREVEGVDSGSFRKDSCGAWMAREKYGDTTHPFGWEIDHVYPVQLGGNDESVNLRAMNWKNNRSKSVDYPSYHSAVTAEGPANVEYKKVFTVNEKLQGKLSVLYPSIKQ